jgi:hypothetical protein
MGKGEVHIGFWWRNLRETPRCRLNDTIKIIFKKWDDSMSWIYLAQDMGRAGSCECGNEPLISKE